MLTPHGQTCCMIAAVFEAQPVREPELCESSLGGGAKGTAVTFFPADAYTPDMIRMARAISKAGSSPASHQAMMAS